MQQTSAPIALCTTLTSTQHHGRSTAQWRPGQALDGAGDAHLHDAIWAEPRLLDVALGQSLGEVHLQVALTDLRRQPLLGTGNGLQHDENKPID